MKYLNGGVSSTDGFESIIYQANKGDAIAQGFACICCMRGATNKLFKQPYDYALGKEYAKISMSSQSAPNLHDLARQKNPTALFLLAYFYSFGMGMDNLAKYYYREAATLGHPIAQVEYGDTFWCTEDEERVKWLEKAAAQGYSDAQYKLGALYCLCAEVVC